MTCMYAKCEIQSCADKLRVEKCRRSTHFKLAANYLITASSPDHCTIFIHMCLHLLGIRKYMYDITCGK